jgi:hypothetical protein
MGNVLRLPAIRTVLAYGNRSLAPAWFLQRIAAMV